MNSQKSKRRRAIGFVLLLFTLGIIIRLPNLNRPISKHYEFNTAIILINIESWRQAGGGDRLHYTPIMNFQHSGDKFPPNNLFIDKNGNTVYLSFGPGWYIIPYFFYQLFHLPVVPVYLQILNLIFHLTTILIFFYFLEQLLPTEQMHKYFIITAACCFMIFSPGMLWFTGNGYINTDIMLPFILGLYILLLPILQDPKKITAGRLTTLGLLIILLVYIDWYIVFLGILCCLISIYKITTNKKYFWLLLTFGLSVALGILLIFSQYASHMGSEAVFHYWRSRSSVRSLNLADTPFIYKFRYLLAYFFTSFLPLLLLLGIVLLPNYRRKNFSNWSEKEILFLRLFSTSLLFYNLFLFDWSTDHEYTILPWGILLSLMVARFLGQLKNQKLSRALLAAFMVLAIVQYYWINRPGAVSRDGLPFASFKNLGESLSKISPDYTICIKLEQNPMVEYYAGRNILRGADSISVKKVLNELGIKKAVWVTQKAYQVENIQVIP